MSTIDNIINLLLDISELGDKKLLDETLESMNEMHEKIAYICSEEFYNDEILKIYREKRKNELKTEECYK